MGKAFPSRRLRGPLPLRAGRFPRNAPHFRHASARSIFGPAHATAVLGASVIAGAAFHNALAAFTHARVPSPTANGPSGIGSFVVRMADQPLPRPPLAASPATEARPAPPRLSTRTGPCSVTGHAGARVRKEKLRLTEVACFTLSTGRCDTPGHLHGMMRAWRKSCANQRA